ncbi:hypothetical protein BGX28_007556 [Mortierella sp. GBA30]|nr:hypothetical protein BGX28_007556 [Mortierella sp. GBA30]
MSVIHPRWSHASTLVDSIIYFTGGTTTETTQNADADDLGKTSILAETLALDLNIPWSVDGPAFTFLAPLNMSLSGHTMNQVPGTTNLLIAGGKTLNNITSSSILTFDTYDNNARWTTVAQLPPNDSSTMASPYHRHYHAAVATAKNGVLLHGGYQSAADNGTVSSSVITLESSQDFTPQSTSPLSMAPNAPALARHTMTLTADGRAIILGGINSEGVLTNLTSAYVMNTLADDAIWEIVPLSGRPPAPRMAFSAVMVNSTTMLVYGGTPDFNSAYWVTFYLDLPTWTWTSPQAQGTIPRRWGHTATMVGNTMVVAFGLTPRRKADPVSIALLDTTTNTWITEFHPPGMAASNTSGSQDGPLSTGAALGIAFLVTAVIVGGAFVLLVRRRKRRTRNTLLKETMGQQQTARAAIGRQAAAASRSSKIFGKAAALLGIGSILKQRVNTRDLSTQRQQQVQQQQQQQEEEEEEGRGVRPGTNRYADRSYSSQQPRSIVARLQQRGFSLASLGYPDDVVQQGIGQVPISNYAYPKQACAETEKWKGDETLIVFHDLAPAQKEALRQERLLRLVPQEELQEQEQEQQQ